jgi:hypothetical protein
LSGRQQDSVVSHALSNERDEPGCALERRDILAVKPHGPRDERQQVAQPANSKINRRA